MTLLKKIIKYTRMYSGHRVKGVGWKQCSIISYSWAYIICKDYDKVKEWGNQNHTCSLLVFSVTFSSFTTWSLGSHQGFSVGLTTPYSCFSRHEDRFRKCEKWLHCWQIMEVETQIHSHPVEKAVTFDMQLHIMCPTNFWLNEYSTVFLPVLCQASRSNSL